MQPNEDVKQQLQQACVCMSMHEKTTQTLIIIIIPQTNPNNLDEKHRISDKDTTYRILEILRLLPIKKKKIVKLCLHSS